jgi:hypothetical protein
LRYHGRIVAPLDQGAILILAPLPAGSGWRDGGRTAAGGAVLARMGAPEPAIVAATTWCLDCRLTVAQAWNRTQ